jgi:hypothetical protein
LATDAAVAASRPASTDGSDKSISVVVPGLTGIVHREDEKVEMPAGLLTPALTENGTVAAV